MLDLLRELLSAIWRVLLVVPMPWRAEIAIWAAVLVGYQIIYRFLSLLLLPEFWLTNRLRLWRLKPLPGTYVFDSLIELGIRISRLLRWVVLLIACFGLIGWYLQQSVEDATLAECISQMIGWWDSLERKVLAGR